MDFADLPQDSASNAERMGWANASPEVIAKVLNSALAAQDLSGFAALLSDIARDRGLKGERAAHQSIYDMPYASLLPRQKHLLSDAFDLLVLLGLELRPRGADAGIGHDADIDTDAEADE
ncbi:hypothetical protein JJQ59_06895 [Cupriavidus necator]|uniref:Uncharacterized protein n=1 Tax=Cupriavidus necator TaxID=106590 RepID=A0A367PQJ1_CUPNE|nr:hypothetical protein [Cupriavidus necator]QQX85639.1 hypothetical protein JJQ59_06895 [Cupriavidus necator]RCJ10172.1 hypothetical protein DDK22_01780 [Cupriavidus necator]